MIIYNAQGLTSLTRIHGSAAYKAFPLAILSTGILLCYEYFLISSDGQAVVHPYGIGAFVGFFR